MDKDTVAWRSFTPSLPAGFTARPRDVPRVGLAQNILI
jgi:hypothetical protein